MTAIYDETPVKSNVCLEAKNLSYEHSKSTKLFDGLNLKVKTGSITGVLGNNGAGKSTLFNLMAGNYLPTAGEIHLNGVSSKTRAYDYLKSIFFMPEQVELFQKDMMKTFDCLGAFYPNYEKSVLERCLNEFKLESKQTLSKLSLGQKKKAYLSFAMSVQTECYLLDEPTNGLDIESKAQFKKLIFEHMSDERAYLISTHQIEEVSSLIDHLMIIESGSCILNESIETLSETFNFIEGDDLGDHDTLFLEKNVFGHKALARGACDGKFDIEFFYRAIIQDKEPILKELKSN